jgi:hypothetical protein
MSRCHPDALIEEHHTWNRSTNRKKIRCWWNLFRQRILLRPSLWVFIITVLAYWDETVLHGKFVYDDAGSVKMNVVVNGNVNFSEVFRRDFWGTPMSEPASHKSFRPITTISFRLNWIWAEYQHGKAVNYQVDTYGFHVFNVLLHGIVSSLVTESAAFVFSAPKTTRTIAVGNKIAILITGVIFGLHPVHAEAVTNITSRGELLMSFFFLSAFLIYANNVPQYNNNNSLPNKDQTTFSIHNMICIYILPWMCMICSVFSKEQGATTLATLVLYDFIQNHDHGILHYWQCLRRRETQAVAFFRRAGIWTIQSILVAGWRYWLNGETSPDFIADQNPAGFATDRFTRIFSVPWVYCLYIFDAMYPLYLCPDWSGLSIDLIQTARDPRIIGVVCLWMLAGLCGISLLTGWWFSQETTQRPNDTRRIVLLAFFAFMFSPFLLSSNLLVVVGLMKADRVIYLPLMGFCLLEALAFKSLFFQDTFVVKTDDGSRHHRLAKYAIGYLLALSQLTFFTIILHERNIAWSDSLNLWTRAYQINNRSHHTMYNCGYELSLTKRYAEASMVLQPIGNAHVDGPSNTFVYAMVLYNLDQCEEARALIDDALVVIEEKRKDGGVRNTKSSLDRTQSNLLVAKAFCTDDLQESGRTMYKAVQVDPTNQYAVEQATNMVKHIEAIQQKQEDMAKIMHMM